MRDNTFEIWLLHAQEPTSVSDNTFDENSNAWNNGRK